MASPRKIKIWRPEEFYHDFPNLNKRNHDVTSHPTPGDAPPDRPYNIHNCFALAVGDETKWWWPVGYGYWPRKPAAETVEEFVYILTTEFNFRVCNDGSYEKNVRKIAIFTDAKGVPIHVAFQPKYTGSKRKSWKSKMGHNVDLEHELRAVVSKSYGEPVKYLCKDVSAE